MKIPFYQADAFTKTVFGGNPAAICILESFPETEVMQHIAAENNLSETAFFVPVSPGNYDLKWFTPTTEVDLCGHATLAGAHILFNYYEKDKTSLAFQTLSGELVVKKSGELLSMDFPARPPVETAIPEILVQALGKPPEAVLESRDLLVVYKDEETILDIVPDFEKLKALKKYLGIIVTAPGKNSDFVSRFFAPNAGVNEDPVTGSAHSTLIPYWAERLNKNTLHAFQLSRRKGELFCEHQGDRVIISGHAALYAVGEIIV